MQYILCNFSLLGLEFVERERQCLNKLISNNFELENGDSHSCSYLAPVDCVLWAEELGRSSDVASVCVALIMKIKMADDSSPAASEKKQPLTDDMKGLSDVGTVEQKEYLVS